MSLETNKLDFEPSPHPDDPAKAEAWRCLLDRDGGEEGHQPPRLRAWPMLPVGIAVTALSGSRFNVALLGWVAATPWLLYLRRSCGGGGWRPAAAFLAALQVGVFHNIATIVTEPIPFFFAPFLSAPAALVQGVTYLAFEGLRRALGDAWGLVIFPALVVAVEWIGGVVFGGSSWGCLAYTQIDDLALLQAVSLFGLGGVSFLLAASSAVAAVLLDNPDRPARHLPAAAGVWALAVAVQAWGSWRLDQPLPPGPTVTVATVGSDLPFAIEIPPQSELDRAEEVLFERTRSAAEAGAELVVWNEVSTVVPTREAEAALLDRGEAVAREHGVDVVMGYAVPLEEMRRVENKYVWMGPEGAIDGYLKHHPVPGLEGCVPGTEPPRVLRRPWGRAAGAICYDYDFTDVSLAHARGGAGVVAVPASDWRGIDPFHTRMASVRGIEGGFSVVRSVRMGTSGAYDALGRTRATSSWFDDGRRIMLARVPVTPVPTLYSRIGDVLPWTCLGFVVATVGMAIIRRRRCGEASPKISRDSAQASPFASRAPAKAKAA